MLVVCFTLRWPYLSGKIHWYALYSYVGPQDRPGRAKEGKTCVPSGNEILAVRPFVVTLLKELLQLIHNIRKYRPASDLHTITFKFNFILCIFIII
jgi:hypothetical protein